MSSCQERDPRPAVLNCHYCGRFVSDSSVKWEMPYVSDLSVRAEPPDDVPVCARCRDDDAGRMNSWEP